VNKMKIRSVLVTGASAGIGKEVARQLALKPDIETIYLACRNEQRALTAKQELGSCKATSAGISEQCKSGTGNEPLLSPSNERTISEITASITEAISISQKIETRSGVSKRASGVAQDKKVRFAEVNVRRFRLLFWFSRRLR
jgi:NAD(P)-dependent dehydrogenase (short-subunit alcohol dehydrogenase family)